MSYEDETRQRIEARKRNAELKKEQQIKKRKITLGILAAAIVVIYCCSFSFSQER